MEVKHVIITVEDNRGDKIVDVGPAVFDKADLPEDEDAVVSNEDLLTHVTYGAIALIREMESRDTKPKGSLFRSYVEQLEMLFVDAKLDCNEEPIRVSTEDSDGTDVIDESVGGHTTD